MFKRFNFFSCFRIFIGNLKISQKFDDQAGNEKMVMQDISKKNPVFLGVQKTS